MIEIAVMKTTKATNSSLLIASLRNMAFYAKAVAAR